MRSLRLIIGYDGAAYAGWQRQAGAETIQEHLERAIGSVVGATVTVHGAGRTDSGVHALAQSAHVKVAGGPPADAFHKAVNTVLPRDIRILRAREVGPEFHARFSARGKRYLYRIRTDPVPHPIGRRYAHWFTAPLDPAAMRRAARHLIGTHDFASLATSTGNARKSPTVRTVQSLHVLRRRNGIDIAVQGDGFLYNMVRTLAGTLLEVGRGRFKPDDVVSILEARDRRRAGPTLPAQGLFLVRVLYAGE